MGTRADFYAGRGESAEWLGSIAWDGYPKGIDLSVLSAPTEDDFREAVAQQLTRDDATTPDMGWPWPWDDSNTTDYAYAFEDGRVLCYGCGWFAVDLDADDFGDVERDDYARGEFPNMKARANVTMGPRSGLLIIGGVS